MKNSHSYHFILPALTLCLLATLLSCTTPSSQNQGPDGRAYYLFEDGSPKKAVELSEEGTPIGWVTEWYQGGGRKKDYTLNEAGDRHGLYREWDQEGRRIRTGEYFKGERAGFWSTYTYHTPTASDRLYKSASDTLFHKEKVLRTVQSQWYQEEGSPPYLHDQVITDLSGEMEVNYIMYWQANGLPKSVAFEEKYLGVSYSRMHDETGAVIDSTVVKVVPGKSK